MSNYEPTPNPPAWLLWAIIILLVISNFLVFRYAGEQNNRIYRTGYEAGLEQGQWDYVNGLYHSRQLWESAIPQIGEPRTTAVATMREMVCEGFVEQHPDPMYRIDCDE